MYRLNPLLSHKHNHDIVVVIDVIVESLYEPARSAVGQHVEEKSFVAGCCCWRRAGQRRSR